MSDSRSRKDASVGEFDAASGLTHITQQRGRLLFNMGPAPARRTPAVAERPDTAEQNTADHDHEATRRRQRQRVYRSGAHTGRSLFAEEVAYLMQRGALVVFEVEEVEINGNCPQNSSEEDTREPLTLMQFLSLALNHRLVPMAAVDAYAFLKDSKLHPRRSAAEVTTDERHPLSASQRRPFVFDVFKSITQTVYVPHVLNSEGSSDAVTPEDAEPALPHTVAASDGRTDVAVEAGTAPRTEKMKKRKVKRLALIFRVLVFSFQETIPTPKELRCLIDRASTASTCAAADSNRIPVKAALANSDRSVLLFEVA